MWGRFWWLVGGCAAGIVLTFIPALRLAGIVLAVTFAVLAFLVYFFRTSYWSLKIALWLLRLLFLVLLGMMKLAAEDYQEQREQGELEAEYRDIPLDSAVTAGERSEP